MPPAASCELLITMIAPKRAFQTMSEFFAARGGVYAHPPPQTAPPGHTMHHDVLRYTGDISHGPATTMFISKKRPRVAWWELRRGVLFFVGIWHMLGLFGHS